MIYLNRHETWNMKHETLRIITKSAGETKKVGEILAKEIIKIKLKRGKALVIGLEGELGSGKTTFIQGMAKGFGIKERITSPSFVLIKRYKIRSGVAEHSSALTRSFASLFHIDCYRLTKPKDLIDLGFQEIVYHPHNVVVIEWAERVKKILPKDRGWIKFEYLEQNKRKMIIDFPTKYE